MKTTVLQAVDIQLKLYPESTLRDIYKSFFQDEFGPGHILLCEEDATAYLRHELETMQSSNRRRMEPCGRGRNFCRIPLDLVFDGLISEDAYLTAFLVGASEFKKPDVSCWREKWRIIHGIIRQREFEIKDFEEDSDMILEILESGNYVMHHSSRYREAYAPHYRIFSTRRALPV